MKSVPVEYFGKEKLKRMNNYVGNMIRKSTETDFNWVIMNSNKRVLYNYVLTTKFDNFFERRIF